MANDREQGKYLVLPEWASLGKPRVTVGRNITWITKVWQYCVSVMKFIGNNEREVTLRLNTFMFANVSS